MIPYSPGTFCALGLALADIKHDYVYTKLLTREQVKPKILNEIYIELERQGMGGLQNERVPQENRILIRTCDIRYFGQAFK